MPDFHAHLNISSTREDLGIIKPFRPTEHAEDMDGIQGDPDLFPVLSTDSESLQFSNPDAVTYSEAALTPTELFGRKFSGERIPKKVLIANMAALTILGHFRQGSTQGQ